MTPLSEVPVPPLSGNNPLFRPKYDPRLFHQYNFEIRRSINAYDEQMAHQRQGPGRYPKARTNSQGERICADPTCDQVLIHQRSFLCEAHREGRYQAAKQMAYDLQRLNGG